MFRILLCLIFLLTIISKSYACSSPPKRYYLNAERMYWRSQGVVLAKALSFNTSSNAIPFEPLVEFEFEIIEVLKDLSTKDKKPTKTVKLTGVLEKRHEISDFDSHENIGFWADSFFGNGELFGDCNAYGNYKIGETYLLFINISHPKSYELIRSPEDRWYRTIRYISDKFKI